MFARATSRGAGSEARGEGRETGVLIELRLNHLVAQRAGGIYIYIITGLRAYDNFFN